MLKYECKFQVVALHGKGYIVSVLHTCAFAKVLDDPCSAHFLSLINFHSSHTSFNETSLKLL